VIHEEAGVEVIEVETTINTLVDLLQDTLIALKLKQIM
jgi:hypothetical protein